MKPTDQLNDWVEPYDVFVSYARADNGPPEMVTAFVDLLTASFGDDPQPLKVFFDTWAIRDMEDWRKRLQHGLQQSKVMVAFASPAYFDSQYCRLEWEEFTRAEEARYYPGESLAPIFLADSKQLSQAVPDSAKEWLADLSARNGVAMHRHWPNGLSAWQVPEVRERIAMLQRNIRTRIEFGRLLAKVPRDLKAKNPNFVGRKKELAELRNLLQRYERAGLCAVQGVGGIGKSTVAREYAYLFRGEYLGGQFEIDLSTADSLEQLHSQLVQIAKIRLGADIPTNLKETDQYALAKAAFESRQGTVLLILDNLNEDATHLVGRAALDTLPDPTKVHLLATTRADPRTLGGMEHVTLEVLSAADALDLMHRFRPIRFDPADPEYLLARRPDAPVADPGDPTAEQEWKAALRIANRLGRHTLAVTLAAAFLKFDQGVGYATFLAQLEKIGVGLALEQIGSEKAVQGLIQAPNVMIGQLFEKSLVRLKPLALRTLEYASFLPPDIVPLAWLEKLLKSDPEMASHLVEGLGSPPCEKALQDLEGLQYLVGSPYARMHRVVQEVVQARMNDTDRSARRQQVLEAVENRTAHAHDGNETFADEKELAAAEIFVRENATTSSRELGRIAMWLVPLIADRGNLAAAKWLATHSNTTLRAIAAADPDSTEKQRDLSVSLNKLGDVGVASGDLASARRHFEEGLQIARRLAAADPDSAEKQRDLSVSLSKMGNVSVASGDLSTAKRHFAEGLQIARRLAAADPQSAENQRDLSVSLNKLGDVSVASGDLASAIRHFEECLQIARRLAAADPHSAAKQRDLSVSLNKLGDVNVASGDLASARRHFEEGLQIRSRLAAADPHSAQKQRDLSVSLEKMGDVSVALGDLASARSDFEEGLQIRSRLAAADPQSAQKQRGLWVLHWRIANVLEKLGEPGANRHWRSA